MRVVICDDTLLIREGLSQLLRSAGVDVVAVTSDAVELLSAVDRLRPEIVIIDIRMPPTHTVEGLDAARVITDQHPGTGILILSQYLEPEYAEELLNDYPGGIGYLLKERVLDRANLADALSRIGEGECVIDPTIIARVMERKRRENPLAELTQREREVLALVAEGLSNLAIAQRLVVTERTVEAHVTQIFTKLALEPGRDAHRRVLAALTYLRRS